MTDRLAGLLPLELEAEWPRLVALTRGRKRWLALAFVDESHRGALRERLDQALLAVERPLVAMTLPADRQDALAALRRTAPEGLEDQASCRWCELPGGGASLAARLVELETLAPALESRDASDWRRVLDGGLVLVLPSAAREVVGRRTPQLEQAADAVVGGEVGDLLPDSSAEDRAERAALALKAASGARARGQALRALAALEPVPAGSELIPHQRRALDVLAHAEHDLGDPAACLDHVDAWLEQLEAGDDRDRIRAHVLGARAERQLTGQRSPGGLGEGHARAAADLARGLWTRDPGASAHGRLLSLALDVLGLVYRDGGQPARALEVQREALELDRTLVERDEDDPVLRRNLSVGLEHLGDTLREAEQEDEAADCYAECLALRHTMANASGQADPETLHEVFEVLWRIAAIEDKRKDDAVTRATLESARNYLVRAQALAPDSPRIARDLGAVDDWLRELG